MTWMIRRNPSNDVRNLHEEISRFLDSSFPRVFANEESLVQGTWNPSVDLFENDDTIVLEADLPGVEPGEFDLSIENYTLTLRGERKFTKKSEGDNYHRVERSYGRFSRAFTLPSTINVEAVQAEFKDGVLRVTLPKRAEVKPRQIEIAIKTDANANQARSADAK